MGRRGIVGIVVAIVVALVAALSLLADLVGLAESPTLVQVAEWLYPLWLLVIAAVVILGLIVALVIVNRVGSLEEAVIGDVPTRESHRDRRQREHDQRMLQEIRETLPREYVTSFLREHDFGAAWRVEQMRPISALARRNDVEDKIPR